MNRVDGFFECPMQDLTVASAIPEICRQEPVMLGIDEAGRGPVLGPMVYAIAYFPVSKSKEMKKMDFADSKVLTEEQRDNIFAKFETDKCSSLGYICNILSPVSISNNGFRRAKYNLNAYSHDTAIQLVRDVMSKGIEVAELYVDTVGPKDKYQEKLKNIFPDIGKIKVENKADSLFPVVSAASICAKVTRDYVLKNWNYPEKIPSMLETAHGSGYPGDPKTKAFLRSSIDPVFGFPTLVRFSWSTVTALLDAKGIAECTWEEENEDSIDSQTNQITDFFEATSAKKAKLPLKRSTTRHKFFQERRLTTSTMLDLMSIMR
ncbi:Ribonuclease H2 subunit A [Halotydeus destructor]|nr:Ribonuclease H2 subunit A [Halotydeus destructor]